MDSIIQITPYLSFRLANELFAASTFKVLEVIEKQPITPVPKTSSFIKGIINFRGDILPVIDMRKIFNMEPLNTNHKFVIIIFDLSIDNEQYIVGATADNVLGVFDVNNLKTKKISSVGLNYNSDFIEALYQHQNNFIKLIDLNKVFDIEFITNIN